MHGRGGWEVVSVKPAAERVFRLLTSELANLSGVETGRWYKTPGREPSNCAPGPGRRVRSDGTLWE